MALVTIKLFFWQVPVEGFKDIEALDGSFHFIEDELLSILNADGRCVKYYFTDKKLRWCELSGKLCFCSHLQDKRWLLVSNAF